jgi:hypothetical protein
MLEQFLLERSRRQKEANERYWGSPGEPDLRACWYEIWRYIYSVDLNLILCRVFSFVGKPMAKLRGL